MAMSSRLGPIDSITSFGDLLKYLRRRVRLSQRELSIAVGYSESQISRMEHNSHIPDRTTLLALFVPALQLNHEPATTARLLELAGAVREKPTPEPRNEPASGPARLTNLPLQLTRFIGREAEIAAIRDLLGITRLVTLTGPGGAGKTRLALEAAVDQVGQFAQGVWFVPLAGVASSDSLIPAILNVLDLQLYGAEPPLAQLIHNLAKWTTLLVLDNFEHLLSGASQVAVLVQSVPGLTVLATSRERLNLYGEWAFEVTGLSVPSAETVAGLETHSAVRLFVENARRAHSALALRAEDLVSIARICRLVDGLPLGIELAAAWVPTLSCAEIAAEIERSLDFLAATTSETEARHRSIRAVFDQSWHLLTERERGIFGQLTLFRGGFTRDSAQAVAGATLSDLSRLAGKSLIRRTAAGRYEIHELLRQYGTARLRDDPEQTAAAEARHGCHYLGFLAQHELVLKGHGQFTALAEIADDLENIWLAWGWGVRQQQAKALSQALNALWFFTEVKALYREFGQACEQAVTALEQAPDTLEGRQLALGKALVGRGVPYTRFGSFEGGNQSIQAGLAWLRDLAAYQDMAFALNGLAAIVHLQGGYTEEQALLRQSLAAGQLAGDRWITGYSLNDLGLVTFLLGDETEAARLCHASLLIFREIGDQRGLAFALKNLGLITHHLGDQAEAEQLCQESLALWRAFGHRWGIATTLTQLGLIARMTGDRSAARGYFLEAIRTQLEVRLWPAALEALVELADLLVADGDSAPARAVLTAILHHPGRTVMAQHKSEQLLQKLGPPFITSAPSDIDELVTQLLQTAGSAV